MITLYAGAEGVFPAGRVTQVIRDGRQKNRKQKPFPPLPDEEEEAKERPSSETNAPTSEKKHRDDEDSTIDVHVLGQILPTRQFIPSSSHELTLH